MGLYVYTPRITWDQLLRTPAQQLVLYSGKTTWWTTRPQDAPQQTDPAGNRVLRLRWEDFLHEAQGTYTAYGKHGLQALAAAHHGNVTHALSGHPAAVETWDDINRLLDHHQAGLHPQLRPVVYRGEADGTVKLRPITYDGEADGTVKCPHCGLSIEWHFKGRDKDWKLDLVAEERVGPAAHNMTREQLIDLLLREGYRPCDIPACNCGSWHGGHASQRLQELREALGDRVQGKTILQAVKELIGEDV